MPDMTPQPEARTEREELERQIAALQDKLAAMDAAPDWKPAASAFWREYFHTDEKADDLTLFYIAEALQAAFAHAPTREAEVIKWLRSEADGTDKPFGLVEEYGARWALRHAANAIENGVHLSGDPA